MNLLIVQHQSFTIADPFLLLVLHLNENVSLTDKGSGKVNEKGHWILNGELIVVIDSSIVINRVVVWGLL
jgi:hypothetical protein